MVYTAWSSASTFRGSDNRGGSNGARIQLSPQKDWAVNQPESLANILEKYSALQTGFNARQSDSKQLSLADLIVLAGNAAIEKAAENAGVMVKVPFTPGRTDATQEMTDIEAFAALEPIADGFRNYEKGKYTIKPEELLVDKAQLLKLTAPEMTVLVGGLRVLNANYGKSPFGVFTQRPGTLTNDFFVNVLDMNIVWKPMDHDPDVFEGQDRRTGERIWLAKRVDLIFGSNAQLRAFSEVYASDDAQEKFIYDFVKAWSKVMHADLI